MKLEIDKDFLEELREYVEDYAGIQSDKRTINEVRRFDHAQKDLAKIDKILEEGN